MSFFDRATHQFLFWITLSVAAVIFGQIFFTEPQTQSYPEPGLFSPAVWPNRSIDKGDEATNVELTQIGEHEAINLEINYQEEAGWTQIIHHDRAAFIKIHFDKLNLAPGDRVIVTNPDGTETYAYETLDPTSGDHGGLWATSVSGDTAIVTLESTLTNGDADEEGLSEWGVLIDTYTWGYAEPEIAQRNDISIESTCGLNQRQDVVCYQDTHPTEFNQSQAVVRLLITKSNGTFTCTGWRATAQNRILTNEHCLSSQADVNGTEVWFNYERLSCGGGATRPVTKVTGNTLLFEDYTHDVALFTVNDFDRIADFGFLELDVRPPLFNEAIYIPQHGSGNPKEFGLESDLNNGNDCRIDDETRNGRGFNTDAGYFCDTTGGSSGAPVLARSSHKVIALHHFGTGSNSCGGTTMNSGVRIDRIWPLIQPFFENDNPPDGDEFEPDNSAAEATPLTAGESQTHSILPEGDEDWLTFSLTAESMVSLETAGDSGDTRLWLYDQQLNQIEFDDDNGAGLFSHIDRLCETDPLPAGTYYLQVDEFGDNDAISSYDLSLMTQTCASVIGPTLAYQAYTIDDDENGQSDGNNNGQVECGETVEMFVQVTNSGADAAIGILSSYISSDPFVSLLFDQESSYPDIGVGETAKNINDFEFAVSPDTPDGYQLPFVLTLEAVNGGPWVETFEVPVSCQADGDAFEPDNRPHEAKPIADGQKQTRSIMPIRDEDWLTFHLSTSSAVTLETTGNRGDTRLWLYDSNMNQIDFDDDGGDNLFSRIDRLCQGEALSPGTYFVMVDEFAGHDEIKSYDVSFTVTEQCAAPARKRILWDTYHGVAPGYGPTGGYYDELIAKLAASGYGVDEIDSGLLNVDLSLYGAVVINIGSAMDSVYSPAEVTALENYVNDGGGLIIMADNEGAPNGNIQPVAQAFNTSVGQGSISNDLTRLSPHPIFEGVTALTLQSGGALQTPFVAQRVAFDDNNRVGVSVATRGIGRVVTLGDIDIWADDNIEADQTDTTGLSDIILDELGEAETVSLETLDNGSFAQNVFDWVTYAKEAPILVYNELTISDSQSGDASGDGDNVVECGEMIETFISLRNDGSATATNINAVLSSNSPYITIPLNMSSDYPDIVAGQVASNSNDFEIAVADNTPNGTVAQFSLAVTAASGSWLVTFEQPIHCNVNNSPNTPRKPTPADYQMDVWPDMVLTWQGGDPDPSDTVQYDVYLDPGIEPPTTLVCDDVETDARCDPGTLAPDTTYAWQVVAEDNQGRTTTGAIWYFTTIPFNSLPTITLADVTAFYGRQVAMPLTFRGGGHDLASTLFSIDFDETCLRFDPTDDNGDDLPDAVKVNLPKDFSVSVTYSAKESQGELDIFVIDKSSPLAALPDDRMMTLIFDVTCQPLPEATIISPLSFSNTPPPYFGSVDRETIMGVTIQGSVEVLPFAPGDCNRDQIIDGGDISALTLEMFDEDGTDIADIPDGLFPGDPIGCNANQDSVIDNDDLSCTLGLIFEGPNACTDEEAALTPPTEMLPITPEDDDPLPVDVPVLMMADDILVPPGQGITMPITFVANNTEVSALIFSVDYDPQWLTFDPTDGDGNGLPDSVGINLPPPFETRLTVDVDDKAGELDFLIADLEPPLSALPDEIIATLTFIASTEVETQFVPITFSRSPIVSFGTPSGASQIGTSKDGAVLITTELPTAIYLPLVVK